MKHTQRRILTAAATLIGLTMLLSGGGVGCSAPHIRPPANPPNPTVIYLCDYGVHSSLLLPVGNGRFIEYVYGDWAFAVENKGDPLHTLAALFLSFDPAFGRRILEPQPGRAFPWPPNEPHFVRPMIVDAAKVDFVVKDLDARYRQHIATAKLNDAPNYFFTFVKDDQRYSIFHSCNHLTMRNLTMMDCKVDGWTIGSNFLVDPPGDRRPAGRGPSKFGRAVEY
jgi:hypothetical protein